VLADVLVEFEEFVVIEALLRNDLARLSSSAVETIVGVTRGEGNLADALLRRPELRPHTPMFCSGGRTRTSAGSSSSGSLSRGKSCRKPREMSSLLRPQKAGRIP